MRRLNSIVIILISFVLLSACNALRVPKTTMNHEMNAAPTGVIPTKSEWNSPENPGANTEIPVSILIKDKSGEPISSFQTVHEKKMHLFIISKDLAYFSHIHPDYNGDGEFDFTTEFPSGGDYKMIAEFTPEGGVDSSIETHWVHVEGEASPEQPIVPDKKLTKVVDGKSVSLSFDQLEAGKTLHMTFTIEDEKTNKPIKDLEPYLGALGHTVAITADAGNYLHIHPMTTQGSGPKVTFMTIFPEKGIYKIWGQFQQNGEVFTVPFVIEVP